MASSRTSGWVSLLYAKCMSKYCASLRRERNYVSHAFVSPVQSGPVQSSLHDTVWRDFLQIREQVGHDACTSPKSSLKTRPSYRCSRTIAPVDLDIRSFVTDKAKFRGG
jgi:hypothetical protein